jgi:hypothetical protein
MRRAALALAAATLAACATLLGIEDATLAPGGDGELTPCTESSTCCITAGAAAPVECSYYAAFEVAESKLLFSVDVGDAGDGEAPFLALRAFKMSAARPHDGGSAELEGQVEYRLERGGSASSLQLDPAESVLSVTTATQKEAGDTEVYELVGTFDGVAEGVTLTVTLGAP